MLLLISMMNLGNYYCFDLPQTLQTPFRDKFGWPTSKGQLLYTVYSIPNCVLPFFAGIFIAKMGDKLGVLVFGMLVWFGSIIIFLGIWAESYWVVVLGRVVFGFGGESQIVTGLVCCEKWFKGKYLSVAMGMNMIFAYLGSLLNNFFTPFIYTELQSPFQTSVIVCMILSVCTLCSYAYIIMSFKYEHLLEEEPSNTNQPPMLQNPEDPRESTGQNSQGEQKSEAAESTFSIWEIKHLPLTFWVLVGGAITTTCAYFSFTSLATDYFLFRYGMEYNVAKNYSAGVSISVVLFLVLSSWFTGKYGKKSLMLFVAGV
jgi:Na+/melibiose symporter-like transporter